MNILPPTEVEKLSRVEGQLAQGRRSPLSELLTRQVQQIQLAPGEPTATVAIWAEVIRGDGRDVYSVGKYQAMELYAYSLSPVGALQKALKRAHEALAAALSCPQGNLEFENHSLLFWHEIRALKSFLGGSPDTDELISTFLTAESVERSNPMTIEKARALEQGLRRVRDCSFLTTAVIDEVCDILEGAGFDLNASLSAIPGDE